MNSAINEEEVNDDFCESKCFDIREKKLSYELLGFTCHQIHIMPRISRVC